jgi:hypothetical protein
MPAVTLETLGGYLDRLSWPAPYAFQDQPEQLEGYIVTWWKAAGQKDPYFLVVNPMIERGQIILRCSLPFRAPLAVPPSAAQADFLQYLLNRDYAIILGKWSRDKDDGEIVFTLVYGIDDGLPFERFSRLLQLAMNEVESQAPILAGLLGGSQNLADIWTGTSMPPAPGIN